MAAKVVKALLYKCGVPNVWCNCSRQILHVWKAIDGSAKDDKEVFFQMIIGRVVLTAIVGSDFDLR